MGLYWRLIWPRNFLKNGTGRADGNQGGGAGGPRKGGEGECASSPKPSTALNQIVGLSYMKEELVRELEEIVRKPVDIISKGIARPSADIED